ncbi:MAG: hypothetical protein M3Y41_04765 [Pseudomonadota bacterium]|nr:hypothetical protein [Pseudomonadota bacterium]
MRETIVKASLATMLSLTALPHPARSADLTFTCSLSSVFGGSNFHLRRRIDIFSDTKIVRIYDDYGPGLKPLPYAGRLVAADGQDIFYDYPNSARSHISRKSGSFYAAEAGAVTQGTCSASVPNPPQ